MAVTIVDYQESTSWQTAGTSKASPSMTWQDGDLFVVVAGDEGASQPAVPTATGLTFSSVVGNVAGSSCDTRLSTATAVGSGSSAITTTVGSSTFFGFGVWQLRGHNGTGASAEQHTTTHSVNLAVTGTGSTIIWGAFDFSAAAVQGIVPTPDTTRENSTSAQYTAYAADKAGVTGTTAIGIAAGGSAGVISILGIEVKAAAATALAPNDPWVAHPELGPGDFGPDPFDEFVYITTPSGEVILVPKRLASQGVG